MKETQQTIAVIFEQYFKDEEKFMNGNDRAGKRARAQLFDLAKLAKERRKEIQELRNKRVAEKQK